MKRLYGELHRKFQEQFFELTLQNSCKIRESHLISDHVYMLISIPPKYYVVHIVDPLKGETTLYVASKYA